MQFVNWHVAEEIKSKVIQLNAQKRTKVLVNQNRCIGRSYNALKKTMQDSRKEDGSIQMKLVYPAIF